MALYDIINSYPHSEEGYTIYDIVVRFTKFNRDFEPACQVVSNQSGEELNQVLQNYANQYEADFVEQPEQTAGPDQLVFKLTGQPQTPVNEHLSVFLRHKKEFFNPIGELQKTEYYRRFNPDTGEFFGLEVIVHNRYHRRMEDNSKFVFRRLQIIQWLLSSNQVGAEKRGVKYYITDADKVAEGARKRSNIVNTLVGYTSRVFGDEGAGNLLLALKNNIELYLSGVTEPLITQITGLQVPEFDYPLPVPVQNVPEETTIREYVIQALNYDDPLFDDPTYSDEAFENGSWNFTLT